MRSKIEDTHIYNEKQWFVNAGVDKTRPQTESEMDSKMAFKRFCLTIVVLRAFVFSVGSFFGLCFDALESRKHTYFI